ncbi:hypothetical protein Cgig2_007705 [Carnegiea gigantea]|uniref:Uncharacterized protein n=1 Tax=Carnegiea gigantea TaxID=171969 RepID=A0A9Q1K8J8_9CARY|nr:hypothetical protein Cgig2_007705 [Carnegiea gigantea]
MIRGSFGGSYGGGGGGSDGGGMLRTMGRVVRRAGINGTQDPISSSSSSSPTTISSTTKLTQKSSASKHALSLSSCNSNTNSNYNLLAWPPLPNYFSANDFSEPDNQWEFVDNYVGDSVDHVFGPVPSVYEVEHALLSLQQVIPRISSSSRFTNSEISSDIENDASIAMEKASSRSSDSDWIEPSMQMCNQRFPRSWGLDRVYDAFHLLQTEPTVQVSRVCSFPILSVVSCGNLPTVQLSYKAPPGVFLRILRIQNTLLLDKFCRMVISLSSDKAVWDAILNNEAVREIRESYRNAEPSPWIFDENSDPADANPNVLKWIFENMKVKLLEVIGAVSQFLGEIFKPLDEDKTEHSYTFSEKLKSGFLLTIMVLLIVVVARAHKG